MPNNQKIPEGWSVKRLGECVEGTQLGGNYENSESNKGLPLIKMGNLSRGKIVLDKIEYIPENTIHNEKDILHYGDLLFNTRNTLELVGKVSIWKNELPTALFNSNILRFTFNPSIIKNSFFMNYYFNSEKGLKLLRARAIGTTSVAAIYWRDCINMKILLPPLAEQEKIALVLGTWDEAIEKLSNLIEQKKNLKKGLMQKLLTGKIRLPGFTQPWKEVKLGEIGTITSAGVDKKIVEGEKLVRLLNYMDVYRKDFLYSSDTSMTVSAPERQIKNCDLKKGDIFFTPSSETRDDIAHSAVVMEDITNGVYSYHIVRLRPTKPIELKFSAYAFKTDMFYRQAYAWCAGSGQRYVLSQDDFRNMRVFIPTNIAEQQAIADVLSTADEEIDLLNKKLEALKEQKKGLMQQLLTGQTRVKVN